MSCVLKDGAGLFRCLFSFSYLLFSFGLAAESVQESPPQLRIARTGLGYVLLTITNALPDTAYELISGWQPHTSSDANLAASRFRWEWDKAGAVGETNFHIVPSRASMRLFRAQVRSDWDRDGVVDWQDALPHDPTVGQFSIVIDSPAHHATVH